MSAGSAIHARRWRVAVSSEGGNVIGPSKRQALACENLNHRRANAPVAHCPQCGGVVNQNLRGAARCDDAQHVQARRTFAAYCIHCGTQLIAPVR